MRVHLGWPMRKYTVVFLSLLGCSFSVSNAQDQRVSFGVKGGVPISSPPGYNDESRRYIVGPSIEIRLPANFALEFDALYQRIGSSFYGSFSDPENGTAGAYSSRERGNSWQFPLLAKYYIGSRTRTWQPFLSTGYALGVSWNHGEFQSSVTSGTPLTTQSNQGKSDSRSPLNVGAVLAGGVRYNAGRVALLPEFRYTRWGALTSATRKNQTHFLMGIAF